MSSILSNCWIKVIFPNSPWRAIFENLEVIQESYPARYIMKTTLWIWTLPRTVRATSLVMTTLIKYKNCVFLCKKVQKNKKQKIDTCLGSKLLVVDKKLMSIVDWDLSPIISALGLKMIPHPTIQVDHHMYPSTPEKLYNFSFFSFRYNITKFL